MRGLLDCICKIFSVSAIMLEVTVSAAPAPFVVLDPPTSEPGYLSRLLINETPFPGERGYVSGANTRAAMVQVLWVLDSRIHHVPAGYQQEHIAAVKTRNIFDIITAGGEKGQCDGFFRAKDGTLSASPRVEQRVAYLTGIANAGQQPGRFAALLNYARDLARAYLNGGMMEADIFAGITRVGSVPVTGRGYSWMSDCDYYSPGGNFVKIPNAQNGSLGGNRFFTLRKE